MRQKPKRPHSMRHVVVQNAAELDALEEDWSDLLSRSDRNLLPLTYIWTVSWWKNFGGGHPPNIHCLYAGEKLIAVSPMFLESAPYRGLCIDRMTSMANGHSPYWDVLFDRDITLAQVEEFVAAMAE